MNKNPLIIAGKQFNSRLLIGSGKFSSSRVFKEALEKSGAEIVTVALRRVDLNNPQDDIISAIDPKNHLLLPNTSGARNADDAVRLARLARESGAGSWLKLEVTPDPNYLLPDPVETLKAAAILAKEGFTVLPYINADPILSLRLQEVGCAAVMPLGSPIGSHQGLKTETLIKIIIEQSSVPVIVDAGLGAPSHASQAMELGADAVLVNTAIAVSPDPILMAEAFKLGVEAGRMAYLAGLSQPQEKASASSPLTGFLK